MRGETVAKEYKVSVGIKYVKEKLSTMRSEEKRRVNKYYLNTLYMHKHFRS